MKRFEKKEEHKMEYAFYGWNHGDVSPISDEYQGIGTPRDLYDALSDIWCEYTCAPRLREKWSRVYGILRPGGNYHCYNVVGDSVFDLTSEQFGDEVLCYENQPEQSRQVHFGKEEKRQRYEYLKGKLRERLNGNN